MDVLFSLLPVANELTFQVKCSVSGHNRLPPGHGGAVGALPPGHGGAVGEGVAGQHVDARLGELAVELLLRLESLLAVLLPVLLPSRCSCCCRRRLGSPANAAHVKFANGAGSQVEVISTTWLKQQWSFFFDL